MVPLFARSSLILLLAAVIWSNGCLPGPRLKKRNVDLVTEGMTKKQVESILGPPTSADQKDWLVLKQTTYFYKQGSDKVTIVFRDDKVQTKESTLTQ